MNVRRIVLLVAKELVRGPRNFMLVFAIVMPVVLTLLISLLFGSILTGQARLGLFSEGISRVPALARANNSVRVVEYGSESALRTAVAEGVVDAGLAIPAGFDAALQSDQTPTLTVLIWGQSLLRDRATVATALISFVRTIAGDEIPVILESITLGEGGGIPWEERLFPFIVLMTVAIGGVMVPATALVEEKQRRTLSALVVTPTTLADVFAAKAVLGVLISMITAVIILSLNSAFGRQPFLLLLSLLLGAIFSAQLGLILGALTNDVNTLFTTIKAIGLLLYAPALIYIFPQIPSWVGRIFPTYYVMQPIVEITQQGGSWREVAPELTILGGLILLAGVVVAALLRRAPEGSGRLSPA